jgi:RNA polymerase sigma-70 factor, ECF subfamily
MTAPRASESIRWGLSEGFLAGTRRQGYGLTVREELGADPAGLVDRLRRGDQRAFEELVRRYQNRVFGVTLRMLGNWADAEEVAQEVFLRVHRSVGDFRGESKLSTWLYAIASRLCLNRLASGRVRPTLESDDAVLRIESSDADPGEHLERAEVEAALQRAIAELPEERRIVVVLRDLEGLAYEDIAHALGLELGTVRSRLHRARAELKGKMERFFG